MDGIAVIATDEVTEEDGYAGPHTSATGTARSRFLRPRGCSLWALVASLGPGTTLTWDSEHGDEAVYVTDGRLEVEATSCRRRGAIIVEAGVPATVHAVEATEVVHFGPTSARTPGNGPLGPADPTGHGVHVLDERGIYQHGEPGAGATFYADSACPTCRLTLHRDFRAAVRVDSHTHSQDELIYMLSGEIRLGAHTVRAGGVVAIAALRRYGFRSNSGFEFLNYRRDAAVYVGRPGSEPQLETVEHIRARTT